MTVVISTTAIAPRNLEYHPQGRLGPNHEGMACYSLSLSQGFVIPIYLWVLPQRYGVWLQIFIFEETLLLKVSKK